MAQSFLLLEDGNHLQLEDGSGDLLLEDSSPGGGGGKFLLLLGAGQ